MVIEALSDGGKSDLSKVRVRARVRGVIGVVRVS